LDFLGGLGSKAFMGKTYNWFLWENEHGEVFCLHTYQRERSSWFSNLTTSKSMLGGQNARLQDLIALWGNITCLWNHNTQKNEQLFCNKGKKTIVIIVALGVWLERRKEKIYNLLQCFGFWSKINLSLILRSWNYCFSPWRWRTPQKNIKTIMLVGKLQKFNIALSLSQLKLCFM
jgi:hypothetical protein